MITARLCDALFLLLPVFLLSIRWKKKTSAPWWLVMVVLAFGGWALLNLRVYFYYAALEERMRAYEAGGINPPPDFVQTYISDGGKKAAALFLGWLFGPVWSLPWLGIYAIASFAQKKAPNQSPEPTRFARGSS
jgi:hypothetical protein